MINFCQGRKGEGVKVRWKFLVELNIYERNGSEYGLSSHTDLDLGHSLTTSQLACLEEIT